MTRLREDWWQALQLRVAQDLERTRWWDMHHPRGLPINGREYRRRVRGRRR